MFVYLLFPKTNCVLNEITGINKTNQWYLLYCQKNREKTSESNKRWKARGAVEKILTFYGYIIGLYYNGYYIIYVRIIEKIEEKIKLEITFYAKTSFSDICHFFVVD